MWLLENLVTVFAYVGVLLNNDLICGVDLCRCFWRLIWCFKTSVRNICNV
ncbi:hypothetical protein SOVF_010130 [Spinacia oleracea]|nr:hypothetical protein SOVF_010130 [Spinacia oleracea]